MADAGVGDITPEDFQVIVRRAGLELTDDELARLLPMYEQLMGQVSLLHEPDRLRELTRFQGVETIEVLYREDLGEGRAHRNR